MVLILRKLFQFYRWSNELADPRARHFPLLGSPVFVLAITIFYVWFVNHKGRALMVNRKPFQLNTTIYIYNILQIILNICFGMLGLLNSYTQKDFSWTCEVIDFQDNSTSKRNLVLATYLYFLLKIFDLLDTIFFVLRKKNNQITFLHVYHHTGMVIATYVHCKYFAGSHATLLGIINCFVHMIMYFYYFLTSWRPELKASIWWKKHITQLQMVQFFLLIVHFAVPLFIRTCQIDVKITSLIMMIQNLFMFVLFGDFYVKAYMKSGFKSS